MNVTFSIEYHTRWGESLAVELITPTGCIYSMHHCGNGVWSITLPLEIKTPSTISYRYLVTGHEGVIRHELGETHRADIASKKQEYILLDHWNDPGTEPLFSAMFTKCVAKFHQSGRSVKPTPGQIFFEIGVPIIKPGEHVAITGSSAALGEWNPEKALPMNGHDHPFWKINIPVESLANGDEYKFIITGASGTEWEEGPNRIFTIPPASHSQTAVIESKSHFRYPPIPWRGAGVAIPVFSLRSEKDCGVGDFGDMYGMIDWAASTGMKTLQILPINDTTMTGRWTDSYPYNANSTFALHPMYLRLETIGILDDKNAMRAFEQEKKSLNSLPVIDYEKVNRVKTEYLRKIFRQNGQTTLDSPECQQFIKENDYWLRDYVAFCVLRDLNDTADFSRWGEYSVYSTDIVEKIEREHNEEWQFIVFQQYHLDRQLSEVKSYASKRGIALKGDIPIGISPTSVDAWASPHLFNLGSQAGAPPDDFSTLGQNWGFPTYNWEEMSLDNYAWWRARFSKMKRHFDAYRIDHVLGFFRIWEIPSGHVHGLLGHFNPALPLTSAGIKEIYGFNGDVKTIATPYITRETVKKYFPERHSDVIPILVETKEGCYILPEHLNNQKKIAVAYSNDPDMKQGLMSLLDEVLFIPDSKDPEMFHPRIEGYKTFVFQSLSDEDKVAYLKLHEDFYYHRHNDFWKKEALRKLPVLISSTDMLTCAEDLGMIPACVPDVMHSLSILSLEIQRMPKEFGQRFGNLARNPYLSVCTTSTHDMEGVRQWWEDDASRAADYYRSSLGLNDVAPKEATPFVCEKIVMEHLKSPSMLCILPWQDWMSIDGELRRSDPREERINEPANSRHYWRYRMHMTLEDLLRNRTLTRHIKSLITSSGR